MMMARTLNLYLLRRFVVWLLVTSVVFLALATLGDSFETSKLAARANEGGFGALYLSSLRLPLLYLDLLPFIFLFSTVICLIRLSESRELVVIRAAGVSVWQFLLPFIAAALIIGAAMVAFLEPYGTGALNQYRQIENQLSNGNNQAAISANGIWLRENNPEANFILKAEKIINLEQQHFAGLTLHMIDATGRFSERIEAKRGRLVDNQWLLKEVRIIRPDQPVERRANMRFASQLGPDNLRLSFSPPDSITVWQLGDYIETARAAGSNVTGHQVRLHTMMSLPLMLVSMVLVAACFSLPTSRILSVGNTIGMAVLVGFAVYIGNDFVNSLGGQEVVTPLLAGWSTPIVAGLLASRYLLGAEDG